MTISRVLYLFVSCNVLWSVIQAMQPEGHLGCFEDSEGESLVDSALVSRKSGEGTNCKALCKTRTKRYAGTKNWWCYCGSDVVQNKTTLSAECNQTCPKNKSEKCGGKHGNEYHRISLYDTWQTVTTTTSRISRSSSTQAIGSTTTIQTVTTATSTLFSSSRTQVIESSTAAPTVTNTTQSISRSSRQGIDSSTEVEKVTATTNSISQSSSRQGIGSSTVVAPLEGNKLAVYIAVPVSIFVLIVFVLIATVLTFRKKVNQTKDTPKAVYRNIAKAGHSLHAVANNAYNDNDIIPLESPVNVHATKDYKADAATDDSGLNYYTLEQTEDGNCKFNNVDQSSCSAIQNDDNGYGHLHARSTALCDPTYSHTTGPQGITDNTYSHMDPSLRKQNHEVMSNVDQDTYNTCNIKGDVGKLRPAVELNDTDDTYNRLAIRGKATNMGDKHTVSSVNEPDYDHTDVKNHLM